MEDDGKVIFMSKMLILVCPNRTCTKFEDRSTDKDAIWPRRNLNRDFALALEIIHVSLHCVFFENLYLEGLRSLTIV